MKKSPYVVETCPACRYTFIASQNKKPTLKSPSKTCPRCKVETPIWKLINFRKALARGPVIEKVEIPVKLSTLMREVGVRGEREEYQVIAAALVGCYDRLIETTPEASRGIIDGVFGNTVKLAKRALGVVT